MPASWIGGGGRDCTRLRCTRSASQTTSAAAPATRPLRGRLPQSAHRVGVCHNLDGRYKHGRAGAQVGRCRLPSRMTNVHTPSSSSKSAVCVPVRSVSSFASAYSLGGSITTASQFANGSKSVVRQRPRYSSAFSLAIAPRFCRLRGGGREQAVYEERIPLSSSNDGNEPAQRFCSQRRLRHRLRRRKDMQLCHALSHGSHGKCRTHGTKPGAHWAGSGSGVPASTD